ncbi:hypothetical protein CTI12_AA626850 [Artemisia annua]|uniref:Uncharacterized protein n=1 Tax=Artemisia annua TaxID=35608 RepID=A0A2U1KAA1_ARTAN|nr:hypothetical protein CTI12_AA626850 [Artemisia annua]
MRDDRNKFSVEWVTSQDGLIRDNAMLNRVGYTPEISHGMLVEMAEHRKDLDKKTKPILDTLRSYQDLPPDKALAPLAIEDKKRQYNAAEKYLEDVLQSALSTSEDA